MQHQQLQQRQSKLLLSFFFLLLLSIFNLDAKAQGREPEPSLRSMNEW